MSADATPMSDTRAINVNDGGDTDGNAPKIRAAGEDSSSSEEGMRNKPWEVQDEGQMALKYYTRYYTRGVTQLTNIG